MCFMYVSIHAHSYQKDLIWKNKNNIHFHAFCLLKLLVGEMVVLCEKEHLLLKSHAKKKRKNVNYIPLEHIILFFQLLWNILLFPLDWPLHNLIWCIRCMNFSINMSVFIFAWKNTFKMKPLYMYYFLKNI